MSVADARSLSLIRRDRDLAYADYVKACAVCVDTRERFVETDERYRKATLEQGE